MPSALRLPLCLAGLLLAGAASAQPADFSPQQRTVYETYRLSVEVRSSSGYIARPVGASGAYDITRYAESSWRALQGRRGVPEARFYEAAGYSDIASAVRQRTRAEFLGVGLGLGMVGGAVALATLAEPDFTESGTPNLPLMGVLFLGIGGTYLAYDNLMDALGHKTTAAQAIAAADRYNAILIEEIRRAGPNAGAGGR